MKHPSRLFDFIHFQKQKYPLEKAFSCRRDGKWISYSTDESISIINRISSGLLRAGIQRGDRIASVVYQNRPEWTFLDAGMNQIGAIHIPLYATISASEYVYILNDAEVRMAFVGSGDLYDKMVLAGKEVPSLEQIMTFDRSEGRPFWEDLFSDQGMEDVRDIMEGIQPEDLATIIYTSGTTGKPKGVMLSHWNIVSNTIAIDDYIPCASGDRVLSFLPVSHIFERTANYTYIAKGYQVYYTAMDQLGGEEGDIRAVKPHFFTAVPRLLEKVYEKILLKGESLGGIKRALFFWAVKMTGQWEYGDNYSGLKGIKWQVADRLIFSKWREALGGQVKGIVCGSAPLAPRLAQVFSAAGIPIREGYGLTETSPGLCIAQFRGPGARVGYIGPPIPGVEIMVDRSEGTYAEGEGEILARGPNIMIGYYRKPEETHAVFKEIDGKKWFRTGDIGRMDDVGLGMPLLRITDRKKELIKTSGGKYVAPAPIENKLKESQLVDNAMIVGDRRKFVSALIVPSAEQLSGWAAANGLQGVNYRELVNNPAVFGRYEDLVERINDGLSQVEKIKKFILLPGDWLPTRPDGSESELTPTLKLKRRVIQRKFAAEIDQLYQSA